MNFSRIIVCTIPLWLLPIASSPQNTNNINNSQHTFGYYDNQYGPDPALANGVQYVGYDPRIKGHQFLTSEDYTLGSISINGKTFKNQVLNLDIYKNKLILKLRDQFETTKLIELYAAFIDSFEFDGKQFKNISFTGLPQRFYQIIDHGNLKFAIYWRKEQHLVYTSKAEEYFSDPIRESYFLIDNIPNSFSNNKSFINLFSEKNKPLLNKFLKTNHINIKKANNQELKNILIFCTEKLYIK